MNIALRNPAVLLIISVCAIASALPQFVHATQLEADMICKASRCVMTPTPGRRVCRMVPCADITSGFTTTGFCATPISCKATATGGKDGLGLDKVIGILGQLMGQLMKGSQSSPTAPPPTTPTTGSGTCSSTYIVHVVTSDPCAVYVPNVIGDDATTTTNSNVTTDLLNALNGNTDQVCAAIARLCADGSQGRRVENSCQQTCPEDSSAGSSTTEILNQFSTTGTGATKATIVSQNSSTTVNPASGNVFGQAVNILPGLKGDISVLNSGATFIVGNRDQANNTEVAGFYGGDTIGSQPTGLVASWCQSRPWATNVLGKIIPPTFFDGLCSVRGYKVGETPAVKTGTQVSITQSAAQPVKTATTTVNTGPAGTPTVDIWASPTTVSLGARTSIFWTSSGAQSCNITSPDGSFSQHTLTGGASTVAITTATVFTISCLGADGSHATKNVTVQLAI